MAENLRTTRYQNGDPIEHANDYDQWIDYDNPRTGAYIFYNNDVENKNIHGALYSWNAVSDQRNIAPSGWRVPSIEDWQKLIDYLDPYDSENFGHTLREATTAHWAIEFPVWLNPEINSTGFTAIPSGFVHGGLGSFGMGFNCRYWTSSTRPPHAPVYVSLGSRISFSDDIGAAGYTIRCIND